MRIDGVGALFAVAGLLALAGVALRFAPARVAPVPAPPVPIAPREAEPSGREQAEALLSFQEIVRSNVFSQERTAPRTRYMPPELATQAAQTRPRPAGPTYRLFGVAVGPTGAVALIDADPAIPGAEVYRPGDAVGDRRLISIADTAVVLEGPTGRTVLTLPSSSRRSP